MKICGRKDCGKEGVWMPVLQFRVHQAHPPVEAALNLPICDEHQKVCGVPDFLSDEGWEQVCAVVRMMRKMLPKRELTTLRWHRATAPPKVA